MVKRRKPFNKQLHDENDPKARQAVMAFANQRGLIIRENSDIYGIDLFISGTSRTGHVYEDMPVEVERRECWSGEHFPFTTIHIPERKTKFFKTNILYAIVNKTYNKFMFCYSDNIIKYGTQEVSNKYMTKGEYFYNVPLNEWRNVYILEE
tara:strand:+ start:78 stop:530 length:453 start_codon:yes stop_codon:yes gene_type:complete